MSYAKISHDEDAPKDAITEAFYRTEWDGIPRHVYADGRIMKYNWELSSEMLDDHLFRDALEEHIARLMKEQL